MFSRKIVALVILAVFVLSVVSVASAKVGRLEERRQALERQLQNQKEKLMGVASENLEKISRLVDNDSNRVKNLTADELKKYAAIGRHMANRLAGLEEAKLKANLARLRVTEKRFDKLFPKKMDVGRWCKAHGNVDCMDVDSAIEVGDKKVNSSRNKIQDANKIFDKNKSVENAKSVFAQAC